MRALAALVLRLCGCALLVCSCVLALLTLACVSSQVALALHVAPLALRLTAAMPAWLAYAGVVASPLGGVFRTDLFLCALACYLLSRLTRRLAKGVC